jgi:hypothetical protein
MSNREVKKKGGSVQGEPQIGPFSILSPSLRDGPETGLAKK